MVTKRPAQEDPDEAAPDGVFPAVVVCAVCGRVECAGCDPVPRPAPGRSRIPWEGDGTPLGRLYATALQATRGPETFFAALADGEVSTALRFAFTTELLAVASTAVMHACIALVAYPGIGRRLLASAVFRQRAAVAWAVGVVAFAVLLVASHALHGAALGRQARRSGTLVSSSRALRFGLYACGWDLCSSPAGFAAALWSEGLRRAAQLVAASVTAPGRATLAALQGFFGLQGDGALRARRRALWEVMIIALPLTVLLLLGMLITVLAP